ncbi:MAG: hypothetical protein VX589_12690, partial [Myxococcota bacterium]|nr:hypothetical protein [Myxococcota bacterium]
MLTRLLLIGLLGSFGLVSTPGCSLAPGVFEHPPIFQIMGRLSPSLNETDEEDDEQLPPDEDENTNRDLYYVVLSWYLFISNGLTEAPWAVANQTEVVLSENPEFVLPLTDQPPDEAFLPTGQGRILQLPAEGRMAIGFLTVFRPTNDSMEFSWQADEDGGALCPFEEILIVWWDGPELDGQDIGINGGRLKRGLNLLDISVDNQNQETYQLDDAASTIRMPTCIRQS